MNLLPLALSASVLLILNSLPAQQKVHDLMTIQAKQSQIGRYPYSVANMGDLDGDKIADMAILAKQGKFSGTNVNGPIWLYSGKTGKKLRTIIPRGLNYYPAEILRSCADIDGDKKADIVVGFPSNRVGSAYYPEVHIYSSGTGKLLTRLRPSRPGVTYSFARDFDALPDMDGDGSPEIAVGDYRYVSGKTSPGGIHLFSAKTGKLIETITSPMQNRRSVFVGSSARFLGDLNRDGNWEISSWYNDYYLGGQGMVVFSALPIDLSSDTKTLSIFRGGKAVFSIHAGKKHAKDLIIMIGSASGSYPGVKVGQNTLHLNLDAYLNFTLSAPKAVFVNNLSQLDANGEGKGGLRFANLAVPLEIKLF